MLLGAVSGGTALDILSAKAAPKIASSSMTSTRRGHVMPRRCRVMGRAGRAGARSSRRGGYVGGAGTTDGAYSYSGEGWLGDGATGAGWLGDGATGAGWFGDGATGVDEPSSDPPGNVSASSTTSPGAGVVGDPADALASPAVAMPAAGIPPGGVAETISSKVRASEAADRG